MDKLTGNVITKLHPTRFPGMPIQMIAILGHVFDTEFTSPYVAEIQVTSDGFVLGRNSDDYGCNQFFGSYEDIREKFDRLVNFEGVNLTKKELAKFWQLYNAKIHAPHLAN